LTLINTYIFGHRAHREHRGEAISKKKSIPRRRRDAEEKKQEKKFKLKGKKL